MKSIAYVFPTFPVPSETFITNEMEAMAALGHPLFPCALEWHSDVADTAIQPLQRKWLKRVKPLPQIPLWQALGSAVAVGYKRAGWQFIRQQRHWRQRSLWLAALRLASWVRANGCNHIHAHFAQHSAAVAIAAAKLCGCTVSFVGHGADIYQRPFDLKAKLQHADLAVAVCRDMQQQFVKQQADAATALIPCGIDIARFSLNHSQIGTQPRLLFVGRLVEKKGVDLLLQALQQLPPTVGLDIVGSGPLLDSLDRMAQRLNVDVRFLGQRDQAWLQANGGYYVALVAPFRIAANGDRDTGPLVCKEAMAMGLPVITTAIMGLPETVNHKCGYLVPPESPEQLAQAIAALLALKPEQRRRLGLRGRLRAERLFSNHHQAQRLSARIEALA
ncbi:glycosyltransferase [Ferrimonas senticii]|uniref:glycosyltransferase n=1 Tax=Ferrimonas senticii TaxID=394566 RepID=UPI00040FD8C9|nr:glycosyltransferase [Ferrimonas senticii]